MKSNTDLCNKILSALEENNIQNFTLNEVITTTDELFFEKKNLTLSRNTETDKCEVTIYNDFEINNNKMRGSSSFIADCTMSANEIKTKISSAYKTALSVHNPYYKLPISNSMFTENDSETIILDNNVDSEYSALELSKMIYLNDNDSIAFINSCEIFVTRKNHHIINSNGVNVSYTNTTYFIEYIVQCKEPEDVELYQDMKFSSLDSDVESSIKENISKSLTLIKDRANATPVNSLSETPVYDTVILEGNCIYELFSYYLSRLDASMIYPGYSSFKIGDNLISSETNNIDNPDYANTTNSFDKINISLTPKTPYSPEGIKLISTNLVKDNIAKCITGNARFSYYLGIPAIGEYTSYKLNSGNISYAEMRKTPHLRIVNFSDFQIDSFTGHFGGEYRLAYYFDGTKDIPVTNGSISGNINDLVKTMNLSSETQHFYDFEGPFRISYKQS